MTEVSLSDGERMEFEIRGGPWEGVHVFVFYIAVTLAVLATVGVLRKAFGIAFIVLLFYSMFTIFSSPTYAVLDPDSRLLTLERYRYFIPRRRHFSGAELESLELVESSRVPAPQGERKSRRDLSYYVRVYLRLKNGRRLKLFRSGMTGAPAENRVKAFLIARGVSDVLDIPISYTRRGVKGDRAEDRNGA